MDSADVHVIADFADNQVRIMFSSAFKECSLTADEAILLADAMKDVALAVDKMRKDRETIAAA